jgi:hypothetical protein
VQNVADVEGRNLVLAQAGAEGDGEDDVVPEAVAVFAGPLCQQV